MKNFSQMALEEYMIPCITKSITGIDCPGCGMQRSLLMLFKGDFSEAFNMYPAIYTLVVLFFILALSFFDKKRDYSKTLFALSLVNLGIVMFSYISKQSHLFF